MRQVISFKISLCVEACNFNHGQNSGRLFDTFAQFSYTPSESELTYYHQNLNLRVLSQAAEQVKALYLRKSRNFKKKPVIQKPMLNIYARKWPKICCKSFQKTPDLLIGTLLQICKSSNIFAFTWNNIPKMKNICLKTFRKNRIRYKIAYFLKKLQTLRINNTIFLNIMNTKFLEYNFYMNTIK